MSVTIRFEGQSRYRPLGLLFVLFSKSGYVSSIKNFKTKDDIHGRLDIVINGTLLPWLTYDVCLLVWLDGLDRYLAALANDPQATIEITDYEQGAPIYKFSREDESIVVTSIVDDVTPDDAEYSNLHLACNVDDFVEGVNEFFQSLRVYLKEISPWYADKWWEYHDPNSELNIKERARNAKRKPKKISRPKFDKSDDNIPDESLWR